MSLENPASPSRRQVTPAALVANPGSTPAAMNAPDRRLRQALAAFQQRTAGAATLRLELPQGERLRMRTLVHRGIQRPVFKVASIKMARVAQCESVLEHEAVLLLDVCPAIEVFAEQPVRIHYLCEGVWRHHIPDVVVIVDGQLLFLEIKFRKDVDDAVLARTKFLQETLHALGARYLLLTESDIRRGALVQNAQRVLRRARHEVCDVRVLQVLHALRQTGQLPLSAFGWSVADSLDAVCIAQLIMRGEARIEVLAPLSDRSLVWPTQAANDEEGAPWWPVASV